MEFNDNKEGCGIEYFHQKDVLPFICKFCKYSFYSEKKTQICLNCMDISSSDKRIVICPVCKKAITIISGEQKEIVIKF